MQLRFFFLIAPLFASGLTSAQQVIYFHNGSTENASVKKIFHGAVLYKHSNSHGLKQVPLNNVDSIVNANGTANARYTGYMAKHTKAPQPLLTNRFQIFATPTSYIDVTGSNMPLGVEYDFPNRWGLGISCSLPLSRQFLIPAMYDLGTSLKSDFKTDLYVRRYVKLRKNVRSFVALDVFYRRQLIYRHNDAYYLADDASNGNGYSTALERKQIFGFNVHCGTSLQIANNFWADFFIGIPGIWFGSARYQSVQSNPANKPRP
jgi:hypothetical protein